MALSEPLSLHERLERWTKEKHWGGDDELVYFGVSRFGLRAIESAIREDAIAPWRERIQRQALAIAEEREEHDALKARADALYGDTKALVAATTAFCEALGDMNDRQVSEKLGRQVSGIALAANAVKAGWSVDAYDAADRAGETQGKTSDLFNVVSDSTIPPGEIHFREGDRTVGKIVGIATPSPTDAPPTEAPDPSTVPWDQQWAKHTADALTQYDRRLDDLAQKVDELQRLRSSDMEFWRGLNNTRAREIADLENRANSTKRSLDTFAESINNTRQDVRNLEQRLDALSRGPEAVTDEMCVAYWSATNTRPFHLIRTDEQESVRAGLEAAFALRAGRAK